MKALFHNKIIKTADIDSGFNTNMNISDIIQSENSVPKETVVSKGETVTNKVSFNLKETIKEIHLEKEIQNKEHDMEFKGI